MSGLVGVHVKNSGSGTTATCAARDTALTGSTFVGIVSTLTGGVPVIADNVAGSPNTYVQVGTELAIGGGISIFMFKCENAVGRTGLIWSMTGGSFPTLAMVELLGCPTSGVLDKTATPKESVLPPAPVVSNATGTISQADEFLVAGYLSAAGALTTILEESSPAYTILESELDGNSQVCCALAVKIVSALGSYTATFDDSVAGNGGVILSSFRIAGAAANQSVAWLRA